jgi:hypothetical protein
MCGGKGKQSVNQTQTYTPNPVAQGAIGAALGQVANVAQTPFQTPVAPVANFSQDQQRAFDLTNQAQGAAMPFFQKAANYFSPEGISQFFNPMASGVMAGMKDIFGQQMKQTTGNLIQQAGGVGADRIAVGQSEMGRQQDLAAGQTLSDMYNRAAQQAQGAAFGMGSLGPAIQNAGLQGAQALLGTGGLQQQLSQAQMNAPYQNILQQIMWPYQNAQFNATNTAALAPGLGGTTNGQTTYPAASPWGSILGAGAAGLGAFGGAGGFNNMFGGGGGGYNQYNPEPFGANADTDPSLIGARGGRVPGRAEGGAVDAGDDPIGANAMMSESGYADGGAPDDNPDDLGGMLSTHPMEGAGGDLIPHQQIQPIKPVIPQLQQPQQGGGGGGDSGWGQAIGTAAKLAMMFVNRGGRVNGYAGGGGVGGMGLMSMLEGGGPGGLLQMLQGGKPMGLMSALQGGDRGDERSGPAPGADLSLLGLPHFALGGAPDSSQSQTGAPAMPQGGFGTGKGGLMSMMGGGGQGGPGGMAGMVQGMMNSPPPSAASAMQGMMNSPPPQMAGLMSRLFGNRGMPGGFGGAPSGLKGGGQFGQFGGHAFDPRSYMRPRARGGPVGYADGGAPDDELIPPPYDPRAAARDIAPNLTSLLGGEKEMPPPQIEGMPPGKVRSFEDPRLMGAVPEAAQFAMPGVAAAAPEISALARPGMTAAREALERAPGIVNKALAGSPGKGVGNPIPYLAGIGAAGTAGTAGGAELAGGPTPEEKAEIGTLETKLGTLDTEIARLRRLNSNDEQFNQKSAKARGDRVRAQAKLDEINGTIKLRKERLESLAHTQLTKETEAEEPFRVKHKDFAKDLPMYSMGAAGGLGLMSGMLNKGKLLKPVGAGMLSGAGEGTLTSMGPSLYDMGNLPLGSKHQKEASEQVWGPVDRGDYSFYKNRVAGDALLNSGIAGTGAVIGSYGPKLLGKAGQYARALLGSRGAGGAETAATAAGQRVKMRMDAEHKIGPAGSEVTYRKYVHPTTGRVMWHQDGKVIAGKNLPPEVPREARGGRISGNPYFADGGAPSFEDMWSDVDKAAELGSGRGGFDPGSSGTYFGDEAKAARAAAKLIPTPRPRPGEALDDGGDDTSPLSSQASWRPPQQPLEPSGGNPYGAPAPQQGGGKFIDSPWAALMNAGLGIMAASGKRDSRGLPTPTLSAIGEGGMHGMQMLGQQRDAAMKQQGIDRQVAALNQQMRHQQEQMDLARAKPVIGPPDENGMRPVYRYNPANRRYEDDSGNAQPATPPPGAPRGGLQNVKLDEGILGAHAQVMKEQYNYSKDAPYLEKGMDVPEPEGVGNKSSRSVQTDGEYYLQTGKLPPVARGQSPVAIQQARYRDAVQNYGNAVAASRGLTPEQMSDMWRTAPGVLRFVLGADGRSTVALGTAVRHLETVRELAKAWAANDQPLISRIRAILGREFGEAAGTNLTTAGRIVGPEIIKAIGVAGAGTAEERHAAQLAFSTAASPEQMIGAIDTTQKLLGGQLEGRKRQAMAAGVSEEKFKGLVGERPYQLLSEAEKQGKGAPAAPAAAAPAGTKPEPGFTGRTATNKDGKKLREKADGTWVP